VSGSTITVASYNMRKAIGTDRRRDPHRVLEVLREIEADVVALQEADRRFGGRASAVPHELIDSHGLYKPVALGVRHKRPLEKARRRAEREDRAGGGGNDGRQLHGASPVCRGYTSRLATLSAFS
jgi:endonuclease/exonuclease/phosphatase family metal-dependent hydrolase